MFFSSFTKYSKLCMKIVPRYFWIGDNEGTFTTAPLGCPSKGP